MSCKSLTKKHSKCSRTATVGVFCWQHRDNINKNINLYNGINIDNNNIDKNNTDKNINNNINNIDNNNTDKNINDNNNNNNNDDKKNNETKTICVKVANLRKYDYISLEHWINTVGNLYIGRRGRVFITETVDGVKQTRIFVYKDSIWGNPFKVIKDLTAEQVCEQYKQYVLGNVTLVNSLSELKGKTLGCFCDQNGSCHAKILKELVDKL